MKLKYLLFLPLGLWACKEEKPVINEFENNSIQNLELTEAELYQKVLGAIVGSAIGDAMGAPTEMWSREAIRFDFGYVDDLDSMVREPSPEGTWKVNLPAGGTTDDTRWKELTYQYLSKQDRKELSSKDFANEILNRYTKAIDHYKEIDSFEPEPYEENTLRVAWLQEWAKVAKPYTENNLDGYGNALGKFYGGEMVCAGLLYAPAFGVFYPSNPEMAYAEAYKLSVFDIGYAKDITALSAALTAQCMKKGVTQPEILAVLRNTDPESYFKSRLVGRTSWRIFQNARHIVSEVRTAEKPLEMAFELLDKNLQDMPFHAGEIYLQVLTAMIYADFDFQKTMEFLVNYGRDNDTTAAVAGTILGAYHGFDKLPQGQCKKVMEVGKKELDIDMEQLAKQLTSKIIALNNRGE